MANTIITKKSTVQGKVPTPAQLQVGELAVNTADGKLFTKHSDDNVREIAAERGGVLWDINTYYKVGDVVSYEYTFVDGTKLLLPYVAMKDSVGITPQHDTSGAWIQDKVVKYIDKDISFYVGSGTSDPYDFPDLQTAVTAVQRYKTIDGAIIYLVLNDNHIIRYPIRFNNFDGTGIVIKTKSNGPIQLSPIDGNINDWKVDYYDNRMVLIAAKNSKLPVFDADFFVTFSFTSTMTSTFDRFSILLLDSSSMLVSDGRKFTIACTGISNFSDFSEFFRINNKSSLIVRGCEFDITANMTKQPIVFRLGTLCDLQAYQSKFTLGTNNIRTLCNVTAYSRASFDLSPSSISTTSFSDDHLVVTKGGSITVPLGQGFAAKVNVTINQWNKEGTIIVS